MKPIIEVRNLSKIYQIGAKSERYISLRDRLSSPSQWFRTNKTEPFYALKDVSFDIMPGETVGIIGRNGAGKSTLLKILSRITPPTSGSIKLRGRVASLLEVGTGFHPELTGRENIYFNGAILGMRKSEINRKLDEIIDFSGVEQFLDTPLKQYSSGMQLRLAFAVAAHLEPEILLIDEVLAVGDAEFQKKCLGKMEDISKGEGRTVVVVSHDMDYISSTSLQSLLLDTSNCIFYGNTSKAINIYQTTNYRNTIIYTNNKDVLIPYTSKAEVLTSKMPGIHKCNEKLEIVVHVTSFKEYEGFNLSIQICKNEVQPVIYAYCFFKNDGNYITLEKGENIFIFTLDQCRLYKGLYTLTLHLSNVKTKQKLETIKSICPFEVVMESDIEFGWQDNVCYYLEDFKWKKL